MTVTVTDDGTGQLTADVSYPENGFVFQNSYASGGGDGDAPSPAKVTLRAVKTLDGAVPADEEFNFVLKDENGTVLQTQKNRGGNITFAPLSFSKIGTYQYTISEVAGTDSGIRYDQTVYTVTIRITKNGDYIAMVIYEKDGQTYNATPTFENFTTTAPDPDPDPDTPDVPTDPDTPHVPDTPTTPDTPITPTTPLDDVPRTNDITHTELWLAVMLISLFGAIITAIASYKGRWCNKRKDVKR